MSRNSRVVLFSALAFFLVGLAWSLWSNRLNKADRAPSLIVLCPKAWIPPSVIEQISQKLKIRSTQLDFESWSDFVRLAANTQGKADVICFHSFLAKDLIQAKFLLDAKLKNLPQFEHVSVDFMQLPFDTDFEYTAPLFWGVNGFVVKDVDPSSWKKIWPQQGSKMSLLFPDPEFYWRMRQSGLEGYDEEADQDLKKLGAFIQSFSKALANVSDNRTDWSADDLKKYQYIQLSSGSAAVFLKNHPDWKYWLPADGVSLWMGMVGVGIGTQRAKKARDFINELLSAPQALAFHDRLHHGAVQSSLDSMDRILPMQKARYLRDIPLDRVRFPGFDLEILPRMERLVLQARHL